MNIKNPDISIILPALNEAEGLKVLLGNLIRIYPGAEIIVVNDGSTDNTSELCTQFNVKEIVHPYSMGNGAAIKSGARVAKGDILVFMDSDGQHKVEELDNLLSKMGEGYDMVVGARSISGHANMHRLIGNQFYNWLASIITGHKIVDLTSGFRVVRADYFRQFLYLLPNGFSYPSTITMAFFRAGFSVAYVPVNVVQRIGKSHLRPLRDGLRFLVIIFKIGTLYSPLKIFVPVSMLLFVTGLGYYAYTFIEQNRFTNMSALLLISAILVFLIGLISEQITTLLYSRSYDKTTRRIDNQKD